MSETDQPSNVIVATQFSRLRGGARQPYTPTDQEFQFEALTALAEALELLGNTFAGYPRVAPPDPQRLLRLGERAAALTRQLPTYLEARAASRSDSSSAPDEPSYE